MNFIISPYEIDEVFETIVLLFDNIDGVYRNCDYDLPAKNEDSGNSY